MYSSFLIITILRLFISIIKWIWIVFTIICLVGAINDASRKYEEKIFNTKTDTNSSDSETDETETEFEEDDEDNTENRWNNFVTALHFKGKEKKEEKKQPEIKTPPLLLKIARYLRYVIVIGYLALHNYYDIPGVISFVFGIYVGKELFMSEYATNSTTLLSPTDTDYIINLKDLKSVDKIKHVLKQPRFKELKEKIIKVLNIPTSTTNTNISSPFSINTQTPTVSTTPKGNNNNNNNNFTPTSTPTHKLNKEFNVDSTNLNFKSPNSTNPTQLNQPNQPIPNPLSNSNQSENNNNSKKSNLLPPPPIKTPKLGSVTNTPVKDITDTAQSNNKGKTMDKNNNNPAMQRLNSSIGSPMTNKTPATLKKQSMVIPHISKDVVLAEIERVQKLYGLKPFMLDIIKYVKEKRR